MLQFYFLILLYLNSIIDIAPCWWQQPFRHWLLASFLNPQSAEEKHYNDTHDVEHTIGLLKGHQPYLDVRWQAAVPANQSVPNCQDMCCAT